MAITKHSNHYFSQKQKKLIDLTTDQLKGVLMDNSFAFNEDTHSGLVNVSANLLAFGNGYTAALDLVYVNHEVDDVLNLAKTSFGNLTVTAAGGSIGPTTGLIIYDSSTIDDTVIGYIDFESSITIAQSTSMELKNIAFIDK